MNEREAYVGTDAESGYLQLAILLAEGLRPESRVLEFGCGALHLAVPLCAYLHRGNYVGVDPNEWLRAPEQDALAEMYSAVFASSDDFTAPPENYDFVFAHSVLSHAADYQLEAFLRNTVDVPRVVASIRLAGASSHHTEWQYPGVTYFSMEHVQAAASKYGRTVERKPIYTAITTAFRPDQYHDWLVFS